ncbi:hypothetical protein [Sulfurimonas sp.]
MNKIEKYINIENELPNLLKVLKDSIQSEFLDIKIIDNACDKYKSECTRCTTMKEAKYVVFSPHIKKEDHKYEQFIFLDETGRTLCHAGGKDFELYGMLQPCSNLEVTEEYRFSSVSQ